MPKKCLICKAEPSPISERSFHMFPKNESIKQNWLDAINVSKTLNFKTAFICSDHFDAESYFYSDELRQRKRLCKEAVPKPYNVNALNRPEENETEEDSKIGITFCDVSDVRENISFETVTIKTEICADEDTLINPLEFPESDVLQDVSSQSHLNKDNEMCTNTVSAITSINSQESDVKDISLQSITKNVTETYTPELPFDNSKSLDGTTPSSNSSTKKRKPNEIRAVTKVRFMTGFKTEYVCQEDFVNEEAWNRFLRYAAYKKSRIAAAHNKNVRKQKKIKILSGVIDTYLK